MISKKNERAKKILYGAFKGFGDLLSAAPTIIAELNEGSEITILVFPQLRSFIRLLDFGANASSLKEVILPVPASGGALKVFMGRMAEISPDLIWISPHAAANVASWKIPILLRLMKLRYWPNAIFAGAESEPCSRLFDIRVPVKRNLPLISREWTAYSLANGQASLDMPMPASFLESLRKNRLALPGWDVVFHPGASRENKRWPVNNCVDLIRRLSVDLRIVVLGLPDEIAPIQSAATWGARIAFVSGTIEEAIETISRSRVAITMDSGGMHFANALNVPTVALFGSLSPTEILPPDTSVYPMYEQRLACQPCGQHQCNYKTIYCMNLLTPDAVERKVRSILMQNN